MHEGWEGKLHDLMAIRIFTFIVCGLSESCSWGTLSLSGGIAAPRKSMNASIPVTASKMPTKCQSVSIYRIRKVIEVILCSCEME